MVWSKGIPNYTLVMKKGVFIAIIGMCCLYGTYAQRITISGTLREEGTGEHLIGANYTEGDPFAQPVRVYSEIENGFGVVMGSSTHVFKAK